MYLNQRMRAFNSVRVFNWGTKLLLVLVAIGIVMSLLAAAGFEMNRFGKWYEDRRKARADAAREQHEKQLAHKAGLPWPLPTDRNEIQKRLALLAAEEAVEAQSRAEHEAHVEQVRRRDLANMSDHARKHAFWVAETMYVFFDILRALWTRLDRLGFADDEWVCGNRLKERELENERNMFLKAQKVRELEERLKPMLVHPQDATATTTTTTTNATTTRR